MLFPKVTRIVNKTITNSIDTNTVKVLSPSLISLQKWGLSLNDTEITRELTAISLECRLFNFPETPFPEELNNKVLTEFEEAMLLRDNEWKATFRMHGKLLFRESPSSPWEDRGMVSIVNRGSIPYRHPGFVRALGTNNGILSLPNQSEIGFQFIDIGSGILRNGDSLVFRATYTEQAESPDGGNVISNLENKLWSVEPTGTQLIDIDQTIGFIDLVNNGSSRIWLNFGSLNGIGYGDPLQPGEKRTIRNSYKLTYQIMGDLWAITEGSTNQPMSAVVGYK